MKITASAVAVISIMHLLAPSLSARDADEGGTAAGRKNVTMDIENGFERYFQYTLYQIGGTVNKIEQYHFPISELKFPLDVWMFYFDFSLTAKEIFTLHINFKKNITSNAGLMEDSDWIPYPDIKTIYSESDSLLTALMTDLDLLFSVVRVSFFSLQMGVGFTHQYLDYRCSDTIQYSIFNPYGPPYIVPQMPVYLPLKVLTYRINYFIPYAEIAPAFTILDKFIIGITLGFCPYLVAQDIDDHLLRGKESRGDGRGIAVMGALKLKYRFDIGIFVTLEGDYLYCLAKGTQKQVYYIPAPYPPTIIENRIESQQFSFGFGAGYSFSL